MTATLVIAHMGHVLIDAPLFLGPPMAMALALWYSSWRNKRAENGERDQPS
jgi:hypothetical protein